MDSLLEKYKKLVEYIKNLESVAVAFSGGVDSTLLIFAAKEALKEEKICAYTVKSGFISEEETNKAKQVADLIGISHKVVEFDENKIEGLCDNPKNRCYLCKNEILKLLWANAGKAGFKNLIEGSNLDDLSDYRPGMIAVKENKVLSPLLECGFCKNDIREILKINNIPIWNKPAMPCLASRIPYGEKITKEKIDMVNKGERFLTAKGFEGVRVRHHGSIARIELNLNDILKVFEPKDREEIDDYFKKLGFKHVTVDLSGYNMGNA